MLNIDSNTNFLYIHIPKCAGTSIEKVFGYDYDNINKYFEYNFKDIGHPKHLTLKMYEKILSEKIINKIFKFSIIRNPFDLLVSLYNYNLHSERVIWNGNNKYEYKKSIPFEYFINFLCNLKIKGKSNILDTSVFSLDGWIEGDYSKMDFIARFENLNEDIKKIFNILNIDKELPLVNKSKIKDVNYKDYYNNKTKDMVYVLFGDELKKYNYDF